MAKLPQENPVPSCTGLISRLAYAHASQEGVNARQLLKRAGLDAAIIKDPTTKLSVAGQIRFIQSVADAMGDVEFGVHLAEDFDLRRLGFLYYVSTSSDTLGMALQRLERYSALVNEGVVVRTRRDKSIRISFDYAGVSRHTDRHQIEFWVTASIRLHRHLVGRSLKPLALRLAHQRTPGRSDLEKMAGIKIRNLAGRDEIEFPAACWNLPIATTDRYLHNLLIGYCEEALARRGAKGSPLRVRVENALAGLLPHGQAQADAIAAKLGMSTRTLARRLKAERLSLSRIVRELRLDLSRRYLADPGLSISQIAWLLGYKEIGAFTHAFRRWTGTTPSVARSRIGRFVA